MKTKKMPEEVFAEARKKAWFKGDLTDSTLSEWPKVLRGSPSEVSAEEVEGKEHRKTVAVLGASANPERYANKAIKLLLAHGHTVIPINPALTEIEGVAVSPSLSAVTIPVDTLTLYLGPANSLPLADQMVALKPGRVIMNPGTESDELEKRLVDAGIPVVRGCTLVMLRTGQF